MRKKQRQGFVWRAITSLAVAQFACTTAFAEGTGDRYDFRIDAGALGPALDQIYAQTGVQLIYPHDLVQQAGITPVNGHYTIEEALSIMLKGTGFSGGLTKGGVIVISLNQDREEAPMTSGTLKKSLLASVGVLMFGAAHAQDVERVEDDEKQEVDNITVTGTNIKGVSDQFSPVTSISREDIVLQGYTTVEEVFQNIPQNFGGGQTADTVGVDAEGGGSAAINLRGFGPESTLVLVNGRRMANGGGGGDFVDISAIPTSAIERVEVLTDGASAIYGSDAVSGVVNIILRNDFEGAETRVGYDLVADGGAGTFTVGQSVGAASDRANGMFSYQYSASEPLLAGNKDFAEDLPADHELTAFNQKNSVFASGGYQLSDQVRLSTDFLYNDRKSKQSNNSVQLSGNVLAAGLTEAQQFSGSGSLFVGLTDQWNLTVTGTYSSSDLSTESIDLTSNTVTTVEADYKNLSGDILLTGELPSLSSEPTRIAFGAHGRHEDYVRVAVASRDTERDVYAFFGELYTPLVTEANAMPGVHRLAVTAAVRHEDYSDAGATTDPKFGFAWSPFEDFTIRGTYGTSFRAPALSDAVEAYFAVITRATIAESGLSDDPILLLLGTTDELRPEESENKTIGFDWVPSSFDGFSLRATYFDIDYTGRFGEPRSIAGPNGTIVGFSGPITSGVTIAQTQSLIDDSDSLLNFTEIFSGQASADPSDVVAFLDRRSQNFSGAFSSGVDVEGTYTSELAGGSLSLSANATFITQYERRRDPTLPIEDELDTFGLPNSLKLRAGARWAAEDLTLGLFFNHTGDYTDNRQLTPTDIGSWSTADASMSLDLGGISSGGVLDGAKLSMSLRNIFNQDPPTIADVPLVGSTERIVFDSANSDPYGRRLGIHLVKNW